MSIIIIYYNFIFPDFQVYILYVNWNPFRFPVPSYLLGIKQKRGLTTKKCK
jgi:hypothetical protein